MRWPFVSRATFDNEREARRAQMIELRQADERAAGAEARVEMQTHNLAEMRKMYDTLMADYRALRSDGANAPLASPAPTESLGPLTRSALHDMGVGQSGIVRRAMRTRAESIWLENRGEQHQDELTAIAVRQGERSDIT